eukprot:gene4055-2905_t
MCTTYSCWSKFLFLFLRIFSSDGRKVFISCARCFTVPNMTSMEYVVQNYLVDIGTRIRQEGNDASANLIESIVLEFQRRHWHEMSMGLLELITDSNVLTAPYEFHSKVLAPIRADIAPMVYVQLVHYICLLSSEYNFEKAMALLDEAATSVRDCRQSGNALRCIRALLLLRECTEEDAMSAAVGSNSYVARKILDEVEQYLQTLQIHEVEPLLVELHCLARGHDYELRRMYTVFYNNAFDVVKHAEKAAMPLADSELSALAYKTAIAALLSEETFNFGRFLNFQIFVAHLSKSHPWLLQWVTICNEGNVSGFETFWMSNESKIKEIPELYTAGAALLRKVQLMALLHLVFYAPFNERVFSFSTIAARCGVEEKAAELLLLEALAQGIIRGRIDGLLKTVHIGWVEPRVLNLKEVVALSEHVSSWRCHVETLAQSVSSMTQEIAK